MLIKDKNFKDKIWGLGDKMQRMLLAVSILLVSGFAQAQEASDAQGVIPRSSGQAPNDAVGVHLGSGLLGTAAVGLQSIYNSNFYLTETDPKSSFGFVLTPSALLQKDAGTLKYEVGLGAEAARYTNVDEGPNSYVDGSINGKLDWAALTRHHFLAEYYTKFSHDPFGSFRTEENLDLTQGLDKWIETSVHGTYRFGAPGALINLESAAGWTGRNYLTNRPETDLLDYRIWDIRESAFFNVSSKTSMVAEILHSNLSYTTNPAGSPDRDSETTNYRVGMHWLATGTTSGDVRVGMLHRDFDDPAQKNTTSVDWNATLTWAPLVYSVFLVQTGQQSQQSYLATVELIQNRFGVVSWTHDFSNYFRTRLAYSYINSQFIGSSRVDKINTVALEANYILTQRWMGIAGASYSKRDSNETDRPYNDTSIYLGIRYGR